MLPNACPLQTILVTDWLISKKYSPLKLLSQMNRNLVGNIYGRSSIKISYFVMFPTKLRFIWLSSFRGEEFLEINQSVTRIVCSGHACKQIMTK
jgi:hypothetical protein